MPNCFVTRVESALCHIEIGEMEGVVKAPPWMQDRQITRPVLDRPLAGGMRCSISSTSVGITVRLVKTSAVRSQSGG
jgi:hypothetical protein